MPTTINSRGQVTIPRGLRRRFGLHPGMVVNITLERDHIAVRPAASALQKPVSGFGLIQSQRTAVPSEFDVANLVADAP